MEACNKFKTSVVKIISKLHRSIYGYKSGLYEASGFIIDVDKGWLSVNKHVVNQAFIQEVQVIFFDGSSSEAKLVYNDPEHDFSIISVDKTLIPLESYPMRFTKSIAKDNDIISNPVFSINKGYSKGENGYLIPVKSSESLSKAMLEFIEDPTLIEPMSKSSRELAVNKFDVNKVNSAILGSLLS